MLKFYAYTGCSSCRNARKWLDGQGIDYQEVAIREQPPSVKELEGMLKIQGGEIRRLFNTSGQDYRSQGLKDTLPSISEKEAIGLLSGNGNLVKRPFVLDQEKSIGLVGFREEAWASAFQG